MLAERCAFLHPAAQRLFLRARQGPMRIDRRHPLLVVLGEDAMDELTFVRFSGNDHALLFLSLARVEPQPRLPRLWVLPVAVIAVLRQDRPDVATEVYRRGPNAVRGQQENRENVSE